jgi:hypothetical protein
MPLFELGAIVATRGAVQVAEKHQISLIELVHRHRVGNWGDLDPDDAKANDNAVREGGRIFSAYRQGECRLWVITEADRSSTCILTPDEY